MSWGSEEIKRKSLEKRKATELERYGPNWRPGPKKGAKLMLRVEAMQSRIDQLKHALAKSRGAALRDWFREKFPDHQGEGHGIVEVTQRLSDATSYKCACGDELVVTGMERAVFLS